MLQATHCSANENILNVQKLEVDTVEEKHPYGNSSSISKEDGEMKLDRFWHVHDFCLIAHRKRRHKV